MDEFSWKTFVATDERNLVWLIYSVNSAYAYLRLKDFGIRASSVRSLTEEETVLYADAIEVAESHKNIAVYVGK